MLVHRILVPVDFSSGSMRALDYAGELAAGIGAEILLLYVFERLDFATYSEDFLPSPQLTQALGESRSRARERLKGLEAQTAARGIRVRSMLADGPPAQRVVEIARDENADLIVIGTLGRSGLAHLLLGSVAERVVRLAHCPVLTVRSEAPPGL